MTWHVVYTEARAEPVVNHRLRAGGYETFWPHYPVNVRLKTGHRTITKLRSQFPRYLFVAADPARGLYDVNNMVGVSTVLFGPEGALTVPEKVIAELSDYYDCNADGLVGERFWEGTGPRYQVGEEVLVRKKVNLGTVEEFLAVVAQVDAGPHMKVWLSMFGGLVQATVAVEDVRPTGGRKRQRVA